MRYVNMKIKNENLLKKCILLSRIHKDINILNNIYKTFLKGFGRVLDP